MARAEEGITAEDAVATIAVAAVTTTVRLQLVTNTVVSHTLLITILHRTAAPHILRLIPLNHNGAQSTGILLTDMRRALCLPTPIILTTPPSHTRLPNIHSNLLTADHRPTLIKDHLLLQTKPNGLAVDNRQEAMVEGDRAEVTMIAMDQSLH
jgi:hypothetical protein